MAYHTRMSPGLRRWLPPVTRIFLPLGVAAALYAPVLTLPYFWDDYPQYNFATSNSYWTLWTNATGLPYYRPLSFTINKFNVWHLAGRGHTAAASVCAERAHRGQACSLAGLRPRSNAQRMVRAVHGRAGWWVGTAAALTFAVYPFATLAVSYLCRRQSCLGHDSHAAGRLRRAEIWPRRQPRLERGGAGRGHERPDPARGRRHGGPADGSQLVDLRSAFAWRHKWVLAALLLVSLSFVHSGCWYPKSRDGEHGAVRLGDAPEILAKISFFLQRRASRSSL